MKSFRNLILICSFTLAGCAGTTGTPYYLPPPGSTLYVIQELPANTSGRAWVQFGRVVSRKDIRVMDPYCQFHTDAGLDGSFAIPQGSYTITHSRQRKDWTALEGTMYAGGANTDTTLSTAMTLTSDEHPAVKQLICSRWSSPNAAGWLKIEDIKTTLDGIAELTIAQ